MSITDFGVREGYQSKLIICGKRLHCRELSLRQTGWVQPTGLSVPAATRLWWQTNVVIVYVFTLRYFLMMFLFIIRRRIRPCVGPQVECSELWIIQSCQSWQGPHCHQLTPNCRAAISSTEVSVCNYIWWKGVAPVYIWVATRTVDWRTPAVHQLSKGRLAELVWIISSTLGKHSRAAER